MTLPFCDLTGCQATRELGVNTRPRIFSGMPVLLSRSVLMCALGVLNPKHLLFTEHISGRCLGSGKACGFC